MKRMYRVKTDYIGYNYRILALHATWRKDRRRSGRRKREGETSGKKEKKK